MVDEIRLYDRALTAAEIRERFQQPEAEHPGVKPVRQWSFRAEGLASPVRPTERWQDAAMEIRLTTPRGTLRQRWELSTEPDVEPLGLARSVARARIP